MNWNTALNEQVRLYHFKFPCWFAWADPPKNFDDTIEEMLLEDIQENGFRYFKKVVYKNPNQLELFDRGLDGR